MNLPVDRKPERSCSYVTISDLKSMASVCGWSFARRDRRCLAPCPLHQELAGLVVL
jgi:hypothetical protein